MSQISDAVLARIASGLSNGGLPRGTARTIYNVVNLLCDSRTWDDVTVFSEPRPWAKTRFAVEVSGKWIITFEFIPELGPIDLKLEKQGKSWRAPRNHSSNRKRRVKS